jgi:Phosphodiester glycosidase
MRGMRRILPALLLGAAMICALVAGIGAGPAVAGAGPTSTTQTLAPGLTLTKIADPTGPQHIFVLTIDPTQSLSVTPTLAGSTMGDYAQTSQIASAHNALAGINGDFTVDPGHPLHSFAQHGSLRQFGSAGTAFGLSDDLANKYIDNRRPTATLQNRTTMAKLPISQLNSGRPSNGDVVAYTTYGTGGGIKPQPGGCSARLKTPSKLHWGTTAQVGVYRDWVVDKVACQPGAMLVKSGTMVLSAGQSGPGARAIQALKRRGIVRVSWSLGWTGVAQTVGGMPEIVTNGKVTAPPPNCGSYFCSANPRTGIGITKTGKILLVIADGRQVNRRGMADWAAGFTLRQFADEMISLGAKYAVNLDGGGGSTMWVQGQGVINRPSDGCEYHSYPSCLSGERPVTNTLLVMNGAGPLPLPFSKHAALPAAFAAAVTPAAAPVVQLASAQQAGLAMQDSLADPGSTGGLMDALVGGHLGRSLGVPSSYLRMAVAFRSAGR